jgi:two-component system sensor histidine kinase CpxA
MKPTSSLFAKILSWFFLNLLLVVAALTVFFAFQPQVNLHAIFGQQGSDRLRTAGMLIVHDLNEAAPAQWPDILARHAAIHRVDFMLVLRDGTVFSPTKEKLPERVMVRVRDALRHKRPGKGRRRLRPPRERFNPQRFIQNLPDNEREPERDNDCRLEKSKDCPKAVVARDGQGRIPHLIMRTREPTRYWFGVHIPLVTNSSHRPMPALLLAVSDSVTGNGFFFDPLPWMVVAAAVLLISVLLWIPLIRNITKPIVRMTRATEEIAKGNFAVSIQEARTDEIGRLAKSINHMTARLSAFVKGQKRFLGDVAHELGSPVARIQFGLGILEQRVDRENQERVRDVMEDVEHMSKLIRELLAFSRAEMNSDAVKLKRILLLPVIEAAVKREETPAVEIDVRIEPETRVLASEELLTRAIANLLRNAVKYAGEAGPITVSAVEKNGQVAISVKDLGPGVSEEYLDRLFEPFFRPEPSRDRDSGGVGLGMAIVKTCAVACKGTVSARNREPRGFAVTMLLT